MLELWAHKIRLLNFHKILQAVRVWSWPRWEYLHHGNWPMLTITGFVLWFSWEPLSSTPQAGVHVVDFCNWPFSLMYCIEVVVLGSGQTFAWTLCQCEGLSACPLGPYLSWHRSFPEPGNLFQARLISTCVQALMMLVRLRGLDHGARVEEEAMRFIDLQ